MIQRTKMLLVKSEIAILVAMIFSCQNGCTTHKKCCEIVASPVNRTIGDLTVYRRECKKVIENPLKMPQCNKGPCYARKTTIRKYNFNEGPRDVENDVKCGHSDNSTCYLAPKTEILLEGHHFMNNITVDVGVCVGNCIDNQTCKPIRVEKKAFQGYYGDEIRTIIKECGCAGGCYRMSFFEKHWNNDGQRWEDVDVGQCVGACMPPQLVCPNLLCHLITPVCVPTLKETFELRSKNNVTNSITKIIECACSE